MSNLFLSGKPPVGTQGGYVPFLHKHDRDPTSHDWQNYFLLDEWLNTVTKSVWFLVSLEGTPTSKGPQALWVMFSGGSGTMLTLTGNTGDPVSPLAGNINVVGDGIGITIAGNPGTHTLTASIIGTTVVNSITPGENINFGGTVAAPIVNLNEIIRWPNTTADGLHGAIYLGATCAANVCTGGTIFMHNFGIINTFLGTNAGNLTLTPGAFGNVGIGINSLSSLTTAYAISAVGAYSLNALTTGPNNCAFGAQSLLACVTGANNCAYGVQSLYSCTASSNSAFGQASQQNTTSGTLNSSFGFGSLFFVTSGSYNLALGEAAGNNYAAAESSNICLMNLGVLGESNIIRIGTQGNGNGQQNKAFIAGIRGVTTDVNNAVAVLISSTGQLGTVSSSAKYKDNIKDLPESKEIYSLRPVVFNYKKHAPESKSVGLIAEEVHKVMPQLVIYKDNEPDTIKYADINIMMLAELIKLNKRVIELEKKLFI